MNVVLAIAAPLVGACAGSFVSTAAMRAVRGEPFISGRSHCDGCGVELGFAATVPVVSFVTRRGACPACGEAIDPVHPAAEIAGAGIALAAVVLPSWQASGLLAALGLTLLGSAVVDLKTRRLPDVLTVIVAALCGALAWLDHALIPGGIAAAATFALLESVRRGFLHLKRTPGLGFGDVKLASALALWLGAATPWMMVLASALGLVAFAVVRPRDGRLPFGPAIALTGLALGLAREAQLWPPS